MSDEIGRELKAEELKPDTVVVVKTPGSGDILMTVWVRLVTTEHVLFMAAGTKPEMLVINRVRPDGTIVDDRGLQVHVFEYLGKV